MGCEESHFLSPVLAVMELLKSTWTRTDGIRPGHVYGFHAGLGGMPWAHVSCPLGAQSLVGDTHTKTKNYVKALRDVVLGELGKLHRGERVSEFTRWTTVLVRQGN